MKNTFLILMFLGFFSCEDYTLAEKEILVKNIRLYDYYEPTTSVIKSSDGFYLKFQKSVTNGDSTKCEAYAKSLIYFSKVDLNGKILWSKEVKSSSDWPYNTKYDERKQLYSVSYAYNSDVMSLMRYDTAFNVVEQKPILLNDYTKTQSFFSGWEYWKDGKFLGYGSVPVSGGTKYKTFFCIMSLQNGIEKFAFDEVERNQYMTLKYNILPDGKIYGVEQSIEGENTNFDIRLYDSDFKAISSKKHVENTLFVSDNTRIRVSEDQITVILQNSRNNEAAILTINKNHEVQKTPFGAIKQGTVSFLDSNDENLYVALNTNPVEIWKIDKIKTTKIDTIDIKFALYGQSAFCQTENGKLIVYGVLLETPPRTKISFFKKQQLQNIQFQKLYESQYKRKCTRWMD